MSYLGLIPMDDLIEEMEKRSVCLVMAFQTYEEKSKTGEMTFRYGKGKWSQAVSLASILQNDVLNNWNNEIQELQRIIEDELF